MNLKLPIFLSLALLAFPSFGETDSLYEALTTPEKKIDFSYKGSLGLRYDSVDDVVKEQVTLGLKADINGRFQIISYVMAGDNYKTDHGRVLDGEIDVRRLYLKAEVADGVYVDAGAMNTTDGDSYTGLSKNGWVDGGRVTLLLRSGDKIEVTAGHLGDPTKTDLFSRGDFDLNYYEIKVSGRVFENLLYKVGFESLDGQNYVRLQGKKSLEILTGQLVRLVGEAMVNLDTDGTKIAAGVQVQIGKMFSEQSNTIAFFDIIHTDTDFGARQDYMGENFLSDDYGTKIQVGVKGKVSGTDSLYWSVSYSHSLESSNHEVRVGIEWKFGGPRLRR